MMTTAAVAALLVAQPAAFFTAVPVSQRGSLVRQRSRLLSGNAKVALVRAFFRQPGGGAAFVLCLLTSA